MLADTFAYDVEFAASAGCVANSSGACFAALLRPPCLGLFSYQTDTAGIIPGSALLTVAEEGSVFNWTLDDEGVRVILNECDPGAINSCVDPPTLGL